LISDFRPRPRNSFLLIANETRWCRRTAGSAWPASTTSASSWSGRAPRSRRSV